MWMWDEALLLILDFSTSTRREKDLESHFIWNENFVKSLDQKKMYKAQLGFEKFSAWNFELCFNLCNFKKEDAQLFSSQRNYRFPISIFAHSAPRDFLLLSTRRDLSKSRFTLSRFNWALRWTFIHKISVLTFLQHSSLYDRVSMMESNGLVEIWKCLNEINQRFLIVWSCVSYIMLESRDWNIFKDSRDFRLKILSSTRGKLPNQSVWRSFH